MIWRDLRRLAQRWLCRWRGHPGVVWYRQYGDEPDMHCTRCEKNLG